VTDAERRIARALFQMQQDQGNGITNVRNYIRILTETDKEN
jgi:hypothetical protein